MAAKLRGRFINVFNTDELISRLSDLLPLKEQTYKIVSVQGSVKRFRGVVECSLQEDDVTAFIENYGKITNETLRKKTPHIYQGKGNKYCKYIYFRCQHRTYSQKTMNAKAVIKEKPSARFRNTDCPFSLCIKFVRHDRADNDYSALIEIDWEHNHSVDSLQALSFKDIPPDVSERVYGLFDKGYTPGLAYKQLYQVLKAASTSEKELHITISDRSKFPRRNDFNYLYTEFHRKKYGTRDLDAMFKILKRK